MLRAVFYISSGLLLYAYVLYPILLAALSSIYGIERKGSDAASPEKWPSLSLILAVYNEERVIAQKISNFLRSDYPGSAEMIVISDGCDDRTVEIAKTFASGRVRVLQQSSRAGKGAALNSAVKHASGEILVFTDANAMFEAQALTELARPFTDPSIGLVTGISRYPDGTIGSVYQRYEQLLRVYESRLGVVAADGAIYAMRSALFQAQAPELINDFMHPILVALQHSNSIMVREAVCVEDFSTDGEFSRQVRMVSQAATVYFRFLPELFREQRWRSIAVLTSHKLLRWLTAPLLAAALISSLVLARVGGIFAVASAAEILFAISVGMGMIARRLGLEGKASFAYQFVALNCAQAIGLWRCFSGEVPVIWKPRNL